MPQFLNVRKQMYYPSTRVTRPGPQLQAPGSIVQGYAPPQRARYQNKDMATSAAQQTLFVTARYLSQATLLVTKKLTQ